MDISEIVRRQLEADERRGFPVKFATDAERVGQLTRDTVGFVGEVGEFANILKKVDLAQRTEKYVGPSLNEASSSLREELADAMIYIIRLSNVLDADIEADLLAKMEKNNERYDYLER